MHEIERGDDLDTLEASPLTFLFSFPRFLGEEIGCCCCSNPIAHLSLPFTHLFYLLEKKETKQKEKSNNQKPKNGCSLFCRSHFES